MGSNVRVPLVQPGTRPELAEIEQSILAQRGRISLLYQVLLNSAPLAAGWEQLLTAIRNRSSVPADLRELAILRVAVLNRAAFEFDAHVPHALAAGLTDAQIEALRTLPAGQAAVNKFDGDAALVLALTDTMTRDVEVPESLMDRIKARFDARGTVELVATVAAYNMVSRLLVALNVAH